MTKNVISIRNICFAYDKIPIYNNFSLDIDEGDIFFIMGINGCGKTTLLKIIGSFLKIDSGKIQIDGRSLESFDSKSLAKVVAYVPQTVSLNSEFLVMDYLSLGRTPYKDLYASINAADYKIIEHYASTLGIEELLDISFNSLSGGQKQLVAIGRALVQETPIIILDEPMSSLDLGRQADFLSLIIRLKKEGKTIILTSHNPDHALAIKESCKICLLHKGTIVSLGDYKTVFTPENIRMVFGDKIFVDTENGSFSFNIVDLV